jgi:hypothetical protein
MSPATPAGLLTEDMRRVITEQRLGFVATVCPDGTPNLAPKGTVAVWDDRHLVFADLRSPQTVRNLRHNPAVEISALSDRIVVSWCIRGASISTRCVPHGRCSRPSVWIIAREWGRGAFRMTPVMRRCESWAGHRPDPRTSAGPASSGNADPARAAAAGDSREGGGSCACIGGQSGQAGVHVHVKLALAPARCTRPATSSTNRAAPRAVLALPVGVRACSTSPVVAPVASNG